MNIKTLTITVFYVAETITQLQLRPHQLYLIVILHDIMDREATIIVMAVTI